MLLLMSLLSLSAQATEGATASDFLNNPKLRPAAVGSGSAVKMSAGCRDRQGNDLQSGDAGYDTCIAEASTRANSAPRNSDSNPEVVPRMKFGK